MPMTNRRIRHRQTCTWKDMVWYSTLYKPRFYRFVILFQSFLLCKKNKLLRACPHFHAWYVSNLDTMHLHTYPKHVPYIVLRSINFDVQCNTVTPASNSNRQSGDAGRCMISRQSSPPLLQTWPYPVSPTPLNQTEPRLNSVGFRVTWSQYGTSMIYTNFIRFRHWYSDK